MEIGSYNVLTNPGMTCAAVHGVVCIHFGGHHRPRPQRINLVKKAVTLRQVLLGRLLEFGKARSYR